ncbi:MAG: hypothetical protein ACOYJ6_16985 [Caulobacterales bacterium]
MAYLISIFPWLLLLLALVGAFGGWCLHCLRTRARDNELHAERNRLHTEFLAAASALPGLGQDAPIIDTADKDRVKELETQLAALQMKSADVDAGVGELQKQLAAARARSLEVDALRARVADLEKAEYGQMPVALAAPVVDDTEQQAAKWRQRYSDARIKYLEVQLAAGAAGPELAPAPAPAPVPVPVPEPEPVDEMPMRRLTWANRYLQARVTHLENQVVEPETKGGPLDVPANDRNRWRQRYLEARVNFLEAREKEGAIGIEAGVRDAALKVKADAERLGGEVAARDAQLAEVMAAAAARTQELAQTRERLDALEGQLANAHGLAEDLARAREQLGALQARLPALETEAQAAAALRKAKEEYEDRLKQADVDLIAARQAANAVQAQIDPLRARIGEIDPLQARIRALEAELGAERAKPVPQMDEAELTRLRWKGRYLDSRVRYLEDRLAGAIARASVAPRPAPILAPLPPAEPPRYAPPPPRYVAPPPIAPAAVKQVERLVWRQVRVVEDVPVEAPPPPPPPEPRYVWRQVRVMDDEPAPPPAPPPPPPQRRERIVWERVPAEAGYSDLEEPRFAAEPAPLVAMDERPPALAQPRGGAPDDLRIIAGIGPKIESTLNSLGVYHFDQIAAWTPTQIGWVEQYLAFPGRILREGWIEQANALARGEETEGMRRYLRGEQT